MATGKMTNATPKSAFHVLGLEDAGDLVLRAELMRKIGAIIEAKQLTQVEAGHLVGMDQPRMSALIRGKITKFSTDSLIRALNDLGHDIELRKACAAAEGRHQDCWRQVISSDKDW